MHCTKGVRKLDHCSSGDQGPDLFLVAGKKGDLLHRQQMVKLGTMNIVRIIERMLHVEI